MNKEYETQVLDLDTDEIVKKLRELNATEEPEVLQRRWVFDMAPCTKDGYGEWIRLRQVGDRKPAITYKNRNGGEIGATTEIEIEVEDFDKAYDLLSAINFDKGRYYQENKRHKFFFR